MSLSYSAELVVGVPYADVVTLADETAEVVRYDETTGEKYTKFVTTEVVRFCGRTMKELGAPDVTTFVENKLKLNFYTAGYDNDEYDVVGVRVGEADQETPLRKVALTKIDAARDTVDSALRACGYTGVKPQVFLTLSAC
jgi:hypothetical protein